VGAEGIRILCAACGELLEEQANLTLSGRVTYFPARDGVPCPTCGSLERRTEIIRATGESIVASSLRITLRSYFSSHLLWTAQREAELAGRMEAAHVAGRSRFDVEHRGHVLSSIVASAAFLEAMVNELYQDAADDHAPPDGYITPLSASCRRLMAELWRSTDGGMLKPIRKYEMLLAFADAQALDRGAQPYQDAALVIRLRNAILHYRPENVSVADEAHAMEQRLGGKFDDNAFMSGSGNPWWPDHALGHGAAVWANRAVKALADHVSDALGIDPNYRRVEHGGWFGDPPAERES
jgi:hypothetical protein